MPQVPRRVSDLIRPDAPASDARDALGLGTAATHASADFDAAGGASAVSASLASHATNTSNPHAVTAAQVGAYTTGQVDTLLTGKLSAGASISGAVVSGDIAGNAANVTGTVLVARGGTGAADAATARANLGLGSVDNTGDAAKPVSTATATALSGKLATANALSELAGSATALANLGLPGPLGSGLAITRKSDAQRQASTPAAGEIVYATDTHLFWVGDGTTAGGVASATGLNPRQMLARGYIQPRARKWLAKALNSADEGQPIPVAPWVGNSLCAGTGASGGSAYPYYQCAARLQAYFGNSTTNAWAAGGQYGQGGSTTANAACYLADVATPSGSALANPAYSADLVVALTMRNDALQALGVSTARMLYRAMARMARARGIDFLFIIDPPQLDATTGAITSAAADAPYVAAMLQAAREEGASVANPWQYFCDLAAAGIDLRPHYYEQSGTATHLVDSGYALLAELAMRALVEAGPNGAAIPEWDRPAQPRCYLVSSYYAYGSGVTATGTRSLNSAGTARKLATGESTIQAFQVPAGGTIQFFPPLGAKGCIVAAVLNSTAGTAYSASFAGISVASGVPAYSATQAVESAAYIPFPTLAQANSTFCDTVTGSSSLTITAAGGGGTLLIAGVTWITESPVEQHATWPGATEVGTWSAGTIAPATGFAAFGAAPACRLSSTVGDTASVSWWGTSLTASSEVGPDQGQASWATDGLSTDSGGVRYGSNQDLYATTRNIKGLTLARNLPEGWHTTVITVAAKNASSSGNAAKLGQYKAQGQTPDPSSLTVAVAAGESLPLVRRWKRATIVQALSGSPTLGRFAPGQTTLAIGGTGAALVRLER